MRNLSDLMASYAEGGNVLKVAGASKKIEPYKTWPERLLDSIIGGFTLPGDVYAGKVDPLSEESIRRAADLAGTVTLGSGAVPVTANELRMGIKAYHGSPYDFDAFDVSKIGTGEGAQAYGRGLYFAENPKVAETYKPSERLMAKVAPGVDYDPNELMAINRAITVATSKRDAVNLLRSEALRAGGASDPGIPTGLRKFPDGGASGSIPEGNLLSRAADRLERGDYIYPGPEDAGRMYEVDINANPDEFLDWDRPLSEQPPMVRDALEKIGYFGEGRSVSEGLRKLASDYGGQDMASAMLQNAGIKGIRYKDAGSRGTDAGTHNYVIFDDKHVKIEKKY